MSEAGIHREIGGKPGLRAQLRHLLKVGRMPNVTIQILPFAVGIHPVMGVGFTHLTFANPCAERVYLEGVTNGVWLHELADTTDYREAFDRVSKLALDERRSAMTLRASIKELE